MISSPFRRTLGRLAAVALGLAPALVGAHGVHSAVPSSAASEQLYGTVHEVVIIDHVAGMTMRQLTLQPAQGAPVALHGTPVDTLKSGATIAVTGRRNGSQFLAESLQTLSTPSGAVQKAGRTVEGRLAMLHSDNVDGTSSYLYEVHGDDGTVTALELAVRPEALGPGMRVSATGSVSAATGALVPDQIDILALGNQDITGQATKVNKVLVILLKFSNTGADPFPTSTAQSVMTTATNSVANYYNEVSYGQQQLAVTITPWLTSTTMAAPSTCDWSGAGNAADAAATAAGYTATYDFRVYVFPQIASCGWSGLGYISFPHLAYINGAGAMQTLVVAHEMGHNFGLLHAASLDCGTLSIGGGSCTSSEYGDPFDVMGNQRAMHFNAAQKSILGWFGASAVKTHSTGMATYTLSPLESAGGSTYAVKIPALAKRTYWLEYRQPIGMDAGLSSFANNGVQVRVAAPFEQLCAGCADDTEFLDMTPSTSAYTDGTLTVGNTFRDETGLSINVLSATASAVTVSVGWGSSSEVPAPDVDGSGTTDLLWRNTATGLSTAWMMSGGSLSWSSALLSSASWSVVADGDFNGDGKADLVWHNSVTGDTSVWLMANGVMSSGATLLSNPNWTVAFTGDFDGDGKTDLLWHNSATGETAIWLMNGAAMKSGAIIMSDPHWSVTVVGDFDGDGKTDLVWRNSVTGETAIWLMNGAAMKSGAIVVVDPNWKATHAGDLNGDGKSDLIWYNSVTGDTNVWIMNGLTRSAGATIRTDVNTHVTHVGDLNNDGKADLIWRNDVSGATIATLMNGTTTVSSATLLTDVNTKVTTLGDFNGDGKADLIWRNSATGVTTLWLMNGLSMTSSSVLVTDPNWVVVNPQ